MNIFVENNGKVYKFSLNEDEAGIFPEPEKREPNILDQILSTIKFTDSASTVDETTGWKIYENDKYGYSFKYPTDGEFEVNNDTVSFNKWGPTQKAQTEFYDALSIQIHPGSLNNQTLEELVNSRIIESEENQIATILESPKPIFLGGIEGITYRAQGLGEFKYIYVSPRKNTFLQIIDGTRDPTNQGFQNIADQILSTFKFTASD